MISGFLKILTFMIAGVASAAAQDLSVTEHHARRHHTCRPVHPSSDFQRSGKGA
jgi:hypothetical protein